MTNADTALILLETELQQWRAANQTARLFLRDDDAIADTGALRKLFEICEQSQTPLMLATIPDPAEPSLGKAVASFGLATAAVHGFRHANYSPKGEKSCELGRHRSLQVVIGELVQGRAKLLDLFDGKLSALLVPPWNRIHDEIAENVSKAGFSGISAHGWLTRPPAHNLANANVHLDIMHWSGGRVGRSHEWVIASLASALGEARRRGWRATGILAHHLVHDEQAWAVLRQITKIARDHELRWISAEVLIDEPAEQPMPTTGQA